MSIQKVEKPTEQQATDIGEKLEGTSTKERLRIIGEIDPKSIEEIKESSTVEIFSLLITLILSSLWGGKLSSNSFFNSWQIDDLNWRDEQITNPNWKNLDTSKSFTPWVKWLLDFIASWESGWNYNAIYWKTSKSEVKFTEMSLWEVLEYQRLYVKNGSPSSAVGKYQFIRWTLVTMVKKYNLDLNQKFTPDFQDKLAILKLEERWLNDFLAGRITLEQFQKNLSKEWAALPKDNNWKSFYHWDGLNKAQVTSAGLVKQLKTLT